MGLLPRLIQSVSESPCTKCPYSGECEKICEQNVQWLSVKHYVAYHVMSFGKCSIYTAINIRHRDMNKQNPKKSRPRYRKGRKYKARLCN